MSKKYPGLLCPKCDSENLIFVNLTVMIHHGIDRSSRTESFKDYIWACKDDLPEVLAENKRALATIFDKKDMHQESVCPAEGFGNVTITFQYGKKTETIQGFYCQSCQNENELVSMVYCHLRL